MISCDDLNACSLAWCIGLDCVFFLFWGWDGSGVLFCFVFFSLGGLEEKLLLFVSLWELGLIAGLGFSLPLWCCLIVACKVFCLGLVSVAGGVWGKGSPFCYFCVSFS